jgi:phage terminase small subunit
MPPIPNTRHEAFAQALAKGKSAAEAYTEAGYKGDRTAASRLSTNVNVKARVAELQGRAAQKAIVTIETIAAELEEARLLAMHEDVANPSAAVSASMGKAKLFGLLIDKSLTAQTSVEDLLDQLDG